jgi:hypothetical protein
MAGRVLKDLEDQGLIEVHRRGEAPFAGNVDDGKLRVTPMALNYR